MSYYLPTELPGNVENPAVIAQRLLRLPEFEHLREGEARIEYLMRNTTEIRGQRRTLGSMHMPQVQGQLKDVFLWMLTRLFGELPDFLMVLEHDYWMESDAHLREILVYHELCHAIHKLDKDGAERFDSDGRAVFGLKGHDVEEFSAVVRRYGAYNSDIAEFVRAVEEAS